MSCPLLALNILGCVLSAIWNLPIMTYESTSKKLWLTRSGWPKLFRWKRMSFRSLLRSCLLLRWSCEWHEVVTILIRLLRLFKVLMISQKKFVFLYGPHKHEGYCPIAWLYGLLWGQKLFYLRPVRTSSPTMTNEFANDGLQSPRGVRRLLPNIAPQSCISQITRMLVVPITSPVCLSRKIGRVCRHLKSNPQTVQSMWPQEGVPMTVALSQLYRSSWVRLQSSAALEMF